MKTTGVVKNTDPCGSMGVSKEHQAAGACLVTGEVSTGNKEFAPGLTLSLTGARILLHELQKKVNPNP
ncbi:hypothetical protein [Planococcus versutus]|uniref:AbrB C-terminal domain-containing protein n=1 Tax=Planococcus versutus TaxID=1302659 RepID=A0A1B1S1H3_9BACL|nr:hypothetical protein [Planococcus versutus]ANU27033.1 hypothetical protein I858_008510 [Planococcus versutus]